VNKTFRRTALVATATVAASVVNAALFAPTASATENTWVKNLETGLCITADGGSSLKPADDCRFGDRSQLWDRRGSNIVKAYTNQCLDSNSDGDVYYLECNGGDYQKWTYPGNGLVRNVATGRYLGVEPGYPWVVATTGVPTQHTWQFFGGE